MTTEKNYFITGTDTGVGKTWATVALMRYFKKQGLSVIGMKPVAAGCDWLDGQLKNDDALLLQDNASIQMQYHEINPYAFELPVSPHLADQKNSMQLEVILQAYNHLKNKADVILVEGAGGWLAPLSNQFTIADLSIALEIPVILVVAIKLGCINHTLLTYNAIKTSGIKCAGWIAMCIDPEMAMQEENINTLKNKIPAPLLGVLPYIENMDFDELALHINFCNDYFNPSNQKSSTNKAR